MLTIEMPQVLIAGCGYLGQATADLLMGCGWKVEGWTRSTDAAEKLSAKMYPVRAVDLSDQGQVADCEGEFDAVVHCASTRGGDVDHYRQVYFQGLRNLLSRFASSKIAFVSSTSVYAQTAGEWVTEKSAAEPKHASGNILREAEQLALAHRGIVVRLAGIYGPGRSHLLQSFLAGQAVIDAENDRFINQVHRDDAAGALVLLLDRQSTSCEIFNVVDDQPVLQSECYRWLAAKLNRPLPPLGISTKSRKRGRSNKRVSNGKLRDLGWTPQYPTFADGMEKSVLHSFGL
jgi:nucleoside-diphosphate-sugar epimerase